MHPFWMFVGLVVLGLVVFIGSVNIQASISAHREARARGVDVSVVYKERMDRSKYADLREQQLNAKKARMVKEGINPFK